MGEPPLVAVGAMRQSVELSSCKLDLRHDALRLPTRPFSLRYPGFEDEFDFTTLVHDVFWNDDGTRLILIAPPLLNLSEDLAPKFIALPSGAEIRPVHQRKLWMDKISLSVSTGTTGLAIECASVRFVVAPQPNLAPLFEGKRTIFAMSKNNNLQWLRDWARFYAVEHGCEAVLLYDNNSDRYGLADIDAAVRSAYDGLDVAVVAWPFPYGVFDGRRELSYKLWDSFYSQSALFEHARWRFLASARSVINADIDELTLSDGSGSIFEIVERSQTGYLRYDGWWIENHLQSTPPGRRHRDYCFRKRCDPEQIGCKWAVVPSRSPEQAQWCTHWISGMSPDVAGADIYLRHVRAINTNWDVHDFLSPDMRTTGHGGDQADLEIDELLRQSYQRIFAGEPAAGIMPEDARPVAAKAHGMRALAGRAKGAGARQEAVVLAGEAQRLLPAHPGFASYLAGLLRDEGEAGKADQLQGEAARLLDDDPAYQWQTGRLAVHRDDLATAITHLSKAIELDPGSIETCKELIASGKDGDADGSIRTLLRNCLQAVADGDHATLAEAARVCLGQKMGEEALAAIDRAIAVQPRWTYHQLRARILAAKNDTAGAIGAMQGAIACARDCPLLLHHPDHKRGEILRTSLDEQPAKMGQRLSRSALYMFLASLLIRKGRAAEAEQAARDGLDVDPMCPDNWLLLAKSLQLNGKDEQACEALARCRYLAMCVLERLRRFKHSEAQYIALIGVLAEAGDGETAGAEIASARASGLANWRLEQIAADLAIKRNAPEEAAGCLQRAIALAPHRMALYAQLARLWADEKRWKEVAETWHALTQAAPQNANAYGTLGRSLLRLDDLDGAIAALQRAISLNGKKADWHCDLGALLARKGQWSAAIAACQRAIELAPDLARARRLLEEYRGHG